VAVALKLDIWGIALIQIGIVALLGARLLWAALRRDATTGAKPAA
jgi:hypothetical protein